MADNEAAAKRGKGEKRKGKAAAGKGAKDGDKKKKKNPLILEARQQQLKQLRTQGTPEDQMKEKVREHIKAVVKPAIVEAKSNAEAKNLKGADRKKFVQDSVRTKLGLGEK
jgi:hypothetical protein